MDRNNKTSFLSTMLNVVTETFYRLVSYSLFAEHQLLFSFHMATRILLQHSIHAGMHIDDHNASSPSSLKPEEYSILLKEFKLIKTDPTYDTEYRSPRKGIEQFNQYFFLIFLYHIFEFQYNLQSFI